MGKNLVIGGNQYNNVSQIYIPTTSGNNAIFIDNTILTPWNVVLTSEITVGSILPVTLSALSITVVTQEPIITFTQEG